MHHINKNLSVSQQWVNIFKKCNFITNNLLKLIQAVL